MTVGNEKAPKKLVFPLTKLIYTTSLAGLVYECLLQWGNWFLLTPRMRHSLRTWEKVGNYGYPALTLLFLLAMVAVVLAYRPGRLLFAWPPADGKVGHRPIKSIGLGAIGGLVVSALAAPLVLPGETRAGFLANAIVDVYGMSPGNVLMFLLLAVGLPVTSEMVFRGIVLRTLAEYASPPAATIASSLLFAYFWPVQSWAVGIILGIVSAVLYYRTRTLTAPIVANAVLTVCSVPLAGLYRSMSRV